MESDILNAMNKANEKKFKAIVDHTGSCDGYSYEAGKETELPESVVKALGSAVNVIGEVQPSTPQEPAQDKQPAQEEKKEPEEQQENKEVPAPPMDKMIGK